MEKKQALFNFIERVFYLLAGVQILLGLVWVIGNIAVLPNLEESRLYLQISRDLVMDEYVGFLYPVLLKVLGFLGDKFCVVLYLLQIGAAFISYDLFIDWVWGRNHGLSKCKRHILAAYVVTFPVILQVHMCVLPYSFASSVWLLLLAQLKVLLEQTGKLSVKSVAGVGISWGIGALFLPEYGLMMSFPLVIGFVICGWKKRNRWGVLLMTAFIAVGCVGSALTLTQTPGSLGRIQKSVGATMLSRFAWPYLERNSFFWSNEVKAVFTEEDLRSLSLYPERVWHEFGPTLEKAVGKEKANELYWEMAVDSLMVGTKDAFTAVGRDMLQNISGPIGIQLQWQGKGVSYSGWNYARMAEQTPELTKYYTRFASYSFDFMMIMAVVVWWLQRKKENSTKQRGWHVLVALSFVAVTVWYTMNGNGMQDYMKVLPNNILWCMLPVWSFVLCLKDSKIE